MEDVGKQTFYRSSNIKDERENNALTLTVKDVSLFQLLSSGSLAKSPEGGKTEQLFLHRFITFVILSKSRANI